MKIAIAGGTGAVGRLVVTAVRAAGHESIVLSRSTGVDVMTGHGLREALGGVSTVIDVSGASTLRTAPAVRFFEAATRHLLTAERETGVEHHVALSIVGAAAVNVGYYAGKAAQEAALLASGDRWTLLRTTQFHEFVPQSVARGSMVGVVLAPTFRSQPIAAAEVAAELVRIATGAPQGVAPDLAGPREEHVPDLVRRYLRAVGRRSPVLTITLPGRLGQAMKNGELLAPPGTRTGRQSFQDWLDEAHRGEPDPVSTPDVCPDDQHPGRPRRPRPGR